MSTGNSLLKSPSAIGGASLAGASGAGVCGGIQGIHTYEEFSTTIEGQLSKQGFQYKIISSDMDADTQNGAHDANASLVDKFNFKTYECFKRFFPNVNVDHKKITDSSTSTN